MGKANPLILDAVGPRHRGAVVTGPARSEQHGHRFATVGDRRYNFEAMRSAPTAIHPNTTMREILDRFPGAQRTLFRKYHIGGCSSCGFSPNETLAAVCARNENLEAEEVAEHIVASDAADRAMQIEPRQLADRIRRDEKVQLLDVRTREEYEAVKIDDAKLFTQELMQEILSDWPRERLLVVYDHQGTRSIDAAAYFEGHGFRNVKSLRGGIDAWSVEVDPSLPRYQLETTST
jgi:rhodanese-related sulfurtransferase